MLDGPFAGFAPASGTKQRFEFLLLRMYESFNVKKVDVIRRTEAGFTEDQNHVIDVH